MATNNVVTADATEVAASGNGSDSTISLKSDVRTYVTLIEKDANGIITDTAIQEESGKLDEWIKKHPSFEIAGKQTCRMYEIGDFDGLLILTAGDKEEAYNICNRGIKQKAGQKLNAKLTELSEDKKSLVFPFGDEPVYDLKDAGLYSEETRRRNLSPNERLSKEAIKAGYDPALVAQLIAQLQAGTLPTGQ